MKRYITGAALLLALVTGLSGCLDTLVEPGHSNPLDPSNPNTTSPVPARPAGLTAVVSDRLVELSWSVGDASAIDHYRVYRWEVEGGEDENYELIDTTTETEYADADVRNGTRGPSCRATGTRPSMSGSGTRPTMNPPSSAMTSSWTPEP
jgi:hypothetical protein